MDAGMIAAGAGGLVAGGMIGAVVVALCAAGAVTRVEKEMAKVRERADTWNRKWEALDKRLNSISRVADTIKVAVRGAGGRVARHETAKRRINGLLCQEGRGHECL